MTRKLLLTCLAILPLAMVARTLTPDEALARANTSTALRAPGTTSTASLAYTVKDSGSPLLYVFNAADTEGFMVLSADDCAEAVLGYSDTGSFDYNIMPDALKWWLSEYGRQIKEAAALTGTQPNQAPARRASVTPLISTKWNQDTPFNTLTPILSGKQAPTGCVATAMAQVLYYHQWPTTGIGQHEYNHSSAGTLTFDYAATSFDWDAMTLTYDSNSTQASKDAVATLMYACGVGVDMGYGQYSSGAMTTLIQRALIENFGYDPGIRYLSRSFFSDSQWESLVYGELAEGRPVLYGGQSETGGHQFICDGYADGYYHINWGWGGMSDGYYLLTALTPGSQGIGGSSGGYNTDQDIIIGIQKPQPGSKRGTVIYTNGVLTPENMLYARSGFTNFLSIDANGNQSYFFNNSAMPLSLKYAVKLTDATGQIQYVESYHDYSLSAGNGYGNFYISYDDVANGTYAVTPAFHDYTNEVWDDIYTPYNLAKPLYVTLTDSSVEYTITDESASISFDNLTLQTPLVESNFFRLTGTITSDRDYDTTIHAELFEAGTSTRTLIANNVMVSLKAGVPYPLEYVSNFTRYYAPATPGNAYELQFVDESDRPFGPRIPVNYLSAPASTAIGLNTLSVVTGDKAPADNIRVHGSLTCAQGYMSLPLTIYIFNISGGYPLTSFSTENIFASEGETVEFEAVGSLLDGVPGTRYWGMAMIGGQYDQTHDFTFTLTEPSAKAETNLLTFDHTNPLAALTPVNTVALDADKQWHARSVELVDAVQFHNPTAFTASSLTYTRTFTHDNWAALYLPFALAPEQWADYASQVIEYTGSEIIDGQTVLTFETVSPSATLEANHPYIFRPAQTDETVLSLSDVTVCATPEADTCLSPAGSAYSLYGIYEIKDDMHTTGAYALKDGNFYPTNSSSVVLKPFRVYLLSNSHATNHAPARISILIDSEQSSITDIMGEEHSDNVIYDITGRRVDQPSTGIYILNGNKIYIKK